MNISKLIFQYLCTLSVNIGKDRNYSVPITDVIKVVDYSKPNFCCNEKVLLWCWIPWIFSYVLLEDKNIAHPNHSLEGQGVI